MLDPGERRGSGAVRDSQSRAAIETRITASAAASTAAKTGAPTAAHRIQNTMTETLADATPSRRLQPGTDPIVNLSGRTIDCG